VLYSLVCAVIRADDETRILPAITALKYRLADFIDPDFGLLEELLRLDVLTRRQCAKIRSGDKTVYERNDAMLDLLTSEEQCVKFLNALQRTGQLHVVNYVTQNGGQKHNDVIICELSRILHIVSNCRHFVSDVYYSFGSLMCVC